MMGTESPGDLEAPVDIPFTAVANAWQSLEPCRWDWKKTPRMKGRVSTPAFPIRRNPYEGVIVEFRLVDVVVRTAGLIIKAKAVVGAGYIVAIDAAERIDADTRNFVQRFVGRKFGSAGDLTPP